MPAATAAAHAQTPEGSWLAEQESFLSPVLAQLLTERNLLTTVPFPFSPFHPFGLSQIILRDAENSMGLIKQTPANLIRYKPSNK